MLERAWRTDRQLDNASPVECVNDVWRERRVRRQHRGKEKILAYFTIMQKWKCKDWLKKAFTEAQNIWDSSRSLVSRSIIEAKTVQCWMIVERTGRQDWAQLRCVNMEILTEAENLLQSTQCELFESWAAKGKTNRKKKSQRHISTASERGWEFGSAEDWFSAFYVRFILPNHRHPTSPVACKPLIHEKIWHVAASVCRYVQWNSCWFNLFFPLQHTPWMLLL